MTEDSELLKKRFKELANKSYNAGIFVFTDFLGLAELSTFSEIKKEISFVEFKEFGGAEGTQRVMIRFGSPGDVGYEIPFPISIIKAEPVSMKFADKLTHRDFLGAILNLGIERSTLGDIVIIDNVGYFFAKEDIADYIVSSLSKVKHTDMKLKIIEELPDCDLYKTEPRRIQANGERLDAVIAKVFGMSREDSQTLFKKKLVFADGKNIENTSYIPKSGEVISVRGFGRMIYRGCDSFTKKGKMNITVDLYV